MSWNYPLNTYDRLVSDIPVTLSFITTKKQSYKAHKRSFALFISLMPIRRHVIAKMMVSKKRTGGLNELNIKVIAVNLIPYHDLGGFASLFPLPP